MAEGGMVVAFMGATDQKSLTLRKYSELITRSRINNSTTDPKSLTTSFNHARSPICYRQGTETENTIHHEVQNWHTAEQDEVESALVH